MNDCAESQTRICKAYISDCYGRLAKSYNSCKSIDRKILRNNIFDMLDRIKALLANEIPPEDSIPAEEIDSPAE